MTTIGKLLVLIQLVLTLCFMMLAGAVYSRHESWKAKYETTQTRVDELTAETKRLEAELGKEITDLKKAVTDAQNETDTTRKELALQKSNADMKTAELETLKKQLNTQEALATIAGDEARFRRDEALAQRKINEQLNGNLNTQNARVVQLEDELFNLGVDRRNIVTRYNDLLKENGIFRRVLAANGFETDSKKYSQVQATQEVVFGKVLDTRPAGRGGREMIEVSIGSDDGVREGSVLYVYRTGDRNLFLGTIKLELVKPDKAVGVVELKAKNGVIERNDYVSTKL